MTTIAQAQLVSQEDPGEAVRILEGIDIKKAPAMVQDDVRANLGWEPRVASDLLATDPPSREELDLLRHELDPRHLYL